MSQLVRCPECNLVLDAPSNTKLFRCPCGIVLRNPLHISSSQQTSHSIQLHPGGSVLQNQVSSSQKSSHSIHLNTTTTNTRSDGLVGVVHENVRPPVWTDDSSRSDCELCLEPFTLFNRRSHCRCCGALIHSGCSDSQWPSNMLPPTFNVKGEKLVRICKSCHKSMEKFRNACLHGDVVTAQTEYAKGNIQLNCPYSVFPNSLYPLHCAATSGSIPLVQWLISIGCFVKVKDGRGFTPLAAAAQKGRFDLVKYMVQHCGAEVDEITDRWALQTCLKQAIASAGTHGDNNNNTITPPPSYRSIISNTELLAPKDETEEASQLEIALAASRDSVRAPSFTDSSKNSVLAENVSSKATSSSLSSSGQCIICFDGPVQTCFVPCGHACCCVNCSSQFDECPICRTKVDQIVRTYTMSSS